MTRPATLTVLVASCLTVSTPSGLLADQAQSKLDGVPFRDAAEYSPGDRNLPIDRTYPPEAFYHCGKGGRVLDVTKPPFNAKGDGTTDDTRALKAAMRFVRDHYELIHGPDFAYCEKQNDRNWTIYLPDGVYLVSDTVCQGWPAQAINILKGWSHIQTVEVRSPNTRRS